MRASFHHRPYHALHALHASKREQTRANALVRPPTFHRVARFGTFARRWVGDVLAEYDAKRGCVGGLPLSERSFSQSFGAITRLLWGSIPPQNCPVSRGQDSLWAPMRRPDGRTRRLSGPLAPGLASLAIAIGGHSSSSPPSRGANFQSIGCPEHCVGNDGNRADLRALIRAALGPFGGPVEKPDL